VLIHVLVVSDQDRSRDFHESVLAAQVLLDRDPLITCFADQL
jgi:hypothetical protein